MTVFIDHLAAEPPGLRLWRRVAPLRAIISVLQTGAHPDDETSALLARLALGDGAHVAYACATRGEGGQNTIGTESGAALGLLRALELERAMAMLGTDLLWLDTPGDLPPDFGFARDAAATFARWGRDGLIARLVHAIRLHRPDIVLPTFLDVGGQHGHHRAVTQATIAAFALAADDAVPGLPPWRAAKLYLPTWSGGGDVYDDEAPPPPATVIVEAGAIDHHFAASYAQIGEWSRAYHRSQGMGRDVAPGPHPYPLHRLAPAAAPEGSVFDGLPRTFRDLAATLDDSRVADGLNQAHQAIEATIAAYPDAGTVSRAGRIASAALAAAHAALPGRLDAVQARIVAGKLEAKARHLARLDTDMPTDAPASPSPVVAPEPRVIALNAPRRTVDIVLEPGAKIAPPPGWQIDRTMIGIALTAPDSEDEARHELPVTVAGQQAVTRTAISYPHVRAADLVAPAIVTIQTLRVELPEVARIGYVAGHDRVWPVLRQLGLIVDLLGGQDIAPYAAIMIGVGAFATRPDLATGARLKQWIHGGGHLVTLYHRPGDGWDPDHTPPYRLRIGSPSLRWRVCDPAAAVGVLAPDHKLLTHPNRIGDGDWTGWVRERGLYFASHWAPQYVPLLSLADAGETPLSGGLLSASYGAGRHTHVALALHHQAAALVPGALRLLANLIQPAWSDAA